MTAEEHFLELHSNKDFSPNDEYLDVIFAINMCRFTGAKKICAHPETIHASWFEAQAVENLDNSDSTSKLKTMLTY
jgi:hypothetical protein